MKVTASTRPSGSTTAVMSSLMLRFRTPQVPRLGCSRASIRRSAKAARGLDLVLLVAAGFDEASRSRVGHEHLAGLAEPGRAWAKCLTKARIEKRFTVDGLRYTFTHLVRPANVDAVARRALTGHVTEEMQQLRGRCDAADATGRARGAVRAISSGENAVAASATAAGAMSFAASTGPVHSTAAGELSPIASTAPATSIAPSDVSPVAGTAPVDSIAAGVRS